jgi:HPt (histidine-containing phosphotransfer) domain-containing protein
MDATTPKPTQLSDSDAPGAGQRFARLGDRPGSHEPIAPVFDQAEALDRLDGEPELLVQVATVFLEDYPITLADISASIERKDGDALAFAAHKIKGGLGTLAARRAWAAAAHVERAGRDKRFADALGALGELRTQIDALLPVLRSLVSDGVKA